MDEHWSLPWKIAWGVVAVSLIVLVFFIPFRWWAVLALAGFGGMEGFGLWRQHDAFPPLTQLIHKYVPRIVAFPLMYGIWGAAAAAWLHAPRAWRFFLLLALLGFITTHFDVTFDDDKVQQERTKLRRIPFVRRLVPAPRPTAVQSGEVAEPASVPRS